VPVLLPDGRTVGGKSDKPPMPAHPYSTKGKRTKRRELSHSDPNRRSKKADTYTGFNGQSTGSVPPEIRQYVNLSKNSIPVKFKGANSMYNKPPMAVPN